MPSKGKEVIMVEDLTLSMNQSLANKFERLYKDEKERRQFCENELALIKGVGNNSPEMKKLQEENKKLKEDLMREKEEHQYDNNVHRKEIEELKGRINGSFNRN